VAALWGQPAGASTDFSTGFETSDGVGAGNLHNQAGWSVDQGQATVTTQEAASGQQSVLLEPADPRTQISRDFTESNSAGVVFIDFRIRGGAGKPPSNAPEAASPDAFYIALAADGAVGRVYVYDGDGNGSGTWRATVAAISLDASGRLASWTGLTLRLDFARKTFDVYVDGALAGFNYGLLRNTQESFTRFVFRGNPEMEVYLDDFYAGGSHPHWGNQSGDGIPDAWKSQHALDLHTDVRDQDADGDGLSNLEEFFLGTNPLLADTSRDGLSDADAVDLGANPLLPSNLFPVGLPFSDEFEVWPVGDIHARGGWHVSGQGSAEVTALQAYHGHRSLRLEAEEGGGCSLGGGRTKPGNRGLDRLGRSGGRSHPRDTANGRSGRGGCDLLRC
jgi:hypothetical protein